MQIWNTNWYVGLSRCFYIWLNFRLICLQLFHSLILILQEKWRMRSPCMNMLLLLRKEKNIHKHCRSCLLSILDLYIWYVLNIFACKYSSMSLLFEAGYWFDMQYSKWTFQFWHAIYSNWAFIQYCIIKYSNRISNSETN